jgi:hypothetical protein
VPPTSSTPLMHRAMGRGSSTGTCRGMGRGRPASRLPQSRGPRAPAISAVETRIVGIDRREPSLGGMATEGGAQQRGEAAAGHVPVGEAPRAPAGVERQAFVPGAVPEGLEGDRDEGPGAPAPTALRRDVRGHERIAASVRIDHERRAPAHRGAVTLELLHGEVDAAAVQDPERALDAVPRHQLDQVSILATGETEELAVRALALVVDDPAGERQEVGLAALEPSAQDCPGGIDRKRPPEERREPDDEAHGGDHLAARGRQGAVADRPPAGSGRAARRPSRAPLSASGRRRRSPGSGSRAAAGP